MHDTAQGGVWGTDPVLGFTGDYATNPELAATGHTAATNEALLLDAPTTYNADAFKLSVLPSFRLGNASGYSSVTSDYEHLNVQGEYDTERSKLTASAGATRDSSLYNTYLTNGTTGVRRDAALADLDFDRQLTERVDLNADVNATRVRYGQPAGTSSLVDYHYASIAPSLSWTTVERNKYSLSASVGKYDSLDGTTESRSGNLQAGVTRELTEQWKLTASAGYSRALNRIDAYQDVLVFTQNGPVIIVVPVIVKTSQNGSVYSVNLAHQGERLTLGATVSQQVQPTGFAFLSRQKSVELNATYALSPRWSLSTDLRDTRYQNPTGNGAFYSISIPYESLSVSWQWTEHLTLALTGSAVRETVPIAHFDQHSHEASLTLTRRFNHISLQ